MSNGANPIRAAISSLDGFVPSRQSSRRWSPVFGLCHQFSPISPSKYVRSCAERILSVAGVEITGVDDYEVAFARFGPRLVAAGGA